MNSTLSVSDISQQQLSLSNALFKRRLIDIEELLEAVLLQECGQQLVNLLRQLREMCSSEGKVSDIPKDDVITGFGVAAEFNTPHVDTFTRVDKEGDVDAVILLILNFLVDIIYGFLDPRVSYS